jgi:hypothetical protein
MRRSLIFEGIGSRVQTPLLRVDFGQQVADAIGLRPAEIGMDEWRQIIADSYPIHPTVLIALPSLFRQLAQNERSLFAFLHSDEPWSLHDVVFDPASTGELPIYRLTHLFAYVEANLGPSLFGRARGQRWAMSFPRS